jgi:SP family general alpha glucoside:H+ symporter-like MFS transporter
MATEKKEDEVPVEVRKLSTHGEHAEEIAEAVAVEHTLSFWEAVKLYPKAIGWSMYFSMGVIMLCMFLTSLCFPSNSTTCRKD